MPQDEKEKDLQYRRDAYQDLASTLKATRTIVVKMGESSSRSQLLASLDLADNLLDIEGPGEASEFPAAVALPIELLRAPVSTLTEFNQSPTEGEMAKHAEALSAWVHEAAKWLMGLVEELDPSDVRTHLRGELRTLLLNVTVSKTISGLQNVKEEYDETVDIAQEVNTEVGAKELSKEFSSLASSQASTAHIWTLVAMLLLAATAAAAILLLRVPIGEAPFAYFGRLAVTLPFAGAAVYAARISGHYREMAQWAHSIAVQLSTIRAYSDSLSVDSKNNLRYELGIRAFGSPGGTKEVAVPPSSMNETLNLLERAMAVLKLRSGNSATE